MDKLEWSALEYEARERSVDWFWALGIIVVTGSLASIIYGNYFFAILLIMSGLLLGFFATKPPDMITYELNTRGLKIRNQLYAFEEMKSFWVQSGLNNQEVRMKPILFIKSGRFFLPILTIPIQDDIAEDIYSIMISKNIPEEEMREHPSLKIMDYLGF